MLASIASTSSQKERDKQRGEMHMESEQASNGGERKKLSSRGERMDHHPWEPEVREKMKEK